ncbi:MAG TPA: TonB-dependent receptor plug domain-containing protein, partial [Blastocatellia bacterium]|nr:TonB-dependent receptor plug domain-containing protein [Blastocatellia bacterium]
MTLASARRLTSALYLSLVFAFTAPLVPAQSSLQLDGRVTDPDKAGVTGAAVTLIARDNGSRATVTAAGDGIFRFDRVATGDYLIEVRAPGFAKTVKAVSIKSVNERIDIALDVAALNDGVVVTASGTAQSVDEVSKAVTVIDAQQIELRDEYSVLETLRAAPGVRVVQQGGPGAFASVQIRGLRSFDTGVLVDGLRFRDAADVQGSANGFLSELNVVSLERVEVLRGSGSSLYGSNAIGGVVNLVTDSGGGRLRGQAQLEGGGLGLFRGRGAVAGGAMDDRLFYSAGLSQLNVTGGVDGDDRARQTSLQGLLGYHFTPNVTLSGRVYANDAFAALNDDPAAAPGFAPPPSGSLVRAVPLDRDEQRRVEARGVPLTPDNYNRGDATFIPGLNDTDNRRRSNFFSGALNFTQRLSDHASYRLSYHRVDVNRSFLDGP